MSSGQADPTLWLV